MAGQNNLNEIKGVIFAKPTKDFTYKKGPRKGQQGISRFVVLEIRGNGNGKEYIEFHKFKVVNPSVPLDDFDKLDSVVITYALGGSQWKDDFINETKAVYIKHADVNYNDTRDLRPQRPKKEEVFVTPSPNDDTEDDQLPF